jgi:HPt (histidine-containing phosphotransfer) domain-containing protein
MSDSSAHRRPIFTSPAERHDEVFNLQVTLGRLGGNRELFAKLVHFYFDDAPQLIDQLRHAAVRGEVAQVERAAHTLKSLAANFEALAAAQAAQRVEELAQARNLGAAIECLPELEMQMRRLDTALAAYTEDSTG